MLLEEFTSLGAQLHESSAVSLSGALTGREATALALLIHQISPQFWFLSL